MIASLFFNIGKADSAQIARHLYACDRTFLERLRNRVDVAKYAAKIASQASCFGAWANGELVGLVAVYCNLPDKTVAFITNVSVLPNWQGRGVASRLLAWSIDEARSLGYRCIELEVEDDNSAAIRLYERHGFTKISIEPQLLKMSLNVER